MLVKRSVVDTPGPWNYNAEVTMVLDREGEWDLTYNGVRYVMWHFCSEELTPASHVFTLNHPEFKGVCCYCSQPKPMNLFRKMTLLQNLE